MDLHRKALIVGCAYWVLVGLAAGLVWWPLSMVCTMVGVGCAVGLVELSVWLGDGDEDGWFDVTTSALGVSHSVAWCPPERGVFWTFYTHGHAFTGALCARLRLDYHSCDSCNVHRLTIGPLILQYERGPDEGLDL